MVYPKNKEETQSESYFLLAALIDTFLLLFTFFLIYFVNNRSFPPSEDLDLSLLHLFHILLIIPAYIVVCCEMAYFGIYFAPVAFLMFLFDVYIFVSRLELFITGAFAALTFILVIFDAIFIGTSLAYFISALRAFADTDNEFEPFNRSDNESLIPTITKQAQRYMLPFTKLHPA